MLVNMSHTMAALKGETEQKFNSVHVSSKSGARDFISTCLAMEQECSFSLEGLSSSLSHYRLPVGQSQPPHQTHRLPSQKLL